MSKEAAAKEAAILKMLDCFPSLKATDAFIDALLESSAPHGLRSVVEACKRFTRGEVDGHNLAFPPSGAEFAKQVAFLDSIYKTTDDDETLHNGLMRIDYGGGAINLAGLTREQQDQVMRQKGLTLDGRSMAGFSRLELLAAIGEPLSETIDYDARREQVQRLIGGALKPSDFSNG